MDKTNITEKQKLITKAHFIIKINLFCYICLALISMVNYDLFNIHLARIGILLTPILICVLFLLLLVLNVFMDTGGKPRYSLLKLFKKIDYLLRILVIVLTFVFINTNVLYNISYLYMFLVIFFCANFYIETLIIKKIKNTSDDEIEHIKINNYINLSDNQIIKHKEALKRGVIAFCIITCIIPFQTLLNNKILLSIFFVIYSMVLLYLMKDTYFLLYGKKRGVIKLSMKYLILVCGFITVILLYNKIFIIEFYNFSPSELISLISFFSLPLYLPIRKIYLSLRQSNYFTS